MKKTVKTQSGNKPVGNTYHGAVCSVHYIDKHIAALVENRNEIVEQVKTEFNKTDENIEFELKKLRKG